VDKPERRECMAKKCDKCLRSVRISTTGITKDTLKMDMGGAILYVMPREGGKIDVALNIGNLLDGDCAYCTWNGEKWII